MKKGEDRYRRTGKLGDIRLKSEIYSFISPALELCRAQSKTSNLNKIELKHIRHRDQPKKP